MAVARFLVNMLSVYVGVGVVFSIAFVARGLHRVDPVAKGSSVGFRLIVLPGIAVLWPLMLNRWIQERGRRA